jgi:hypothetical protein
MRMGPVKSRLLKPAISLFSKFLKIDIKNSVLLIRKAKKKNTSGKFKLDSWKENLNAQSEKSILEN